MCFVERWPKIVFRFILSNTSSRGMGVKQIFPFCKGAFMEFPVGENGNASRNFHRGYNTKSLIQSTRSKETFVLLYFSIFREFIFLPKPCTVYGIIWIIVYVFIHVWNKQNKYKYMVWEMRNLVFDISANFLYFLTSVAVMVNLLSINPTKWSNTL